MKLLYNVLILSLVLLGLSSINLNSQTLIANRLANNQPSGDIYGSVIVGDYMYAYGEFNFFGGTEVGYGIEVSTNSATINTANFPEVDGTVNVAIPDGSGGWYIGGDFEEVGGVSRDYAAHILSNGTVDATWDPVFDSDVHTMVLDGDYVYVGGEFEDVDGTTRNYLAKIHKTTGVLDATWNPDANNDVEKILIDGSDIYVIGGFNNIGGQSFEYIAKLNNSNGNADAAWNPAPDYDVEDIVLDGSYLYLVGGFEEVDSEEIYYFARVNKSDGSLDTGFDLEIDYSVSSIAISGDYIYIAGEFEEVLGEERIRLAKIHKTNKTLDATWLPTSDGTINLIVIDGNDIYLGGSFYTIKGTKRQGFAKVNNTNGNVEAYNLKIGNSYGGSKVNIYTIAINGTDMYIGGYFNYGNVKNATRLAKISMVDGTIDENWNWDFNGSPIQAIATDGTYIYVAGSSGSIAPGINARFPRINILTGIPDEDWSGYASNTIYGLHVSGDYIYLGGGFTHVQGENGNIARNRVARIQLSTGNVDAWNPNANNTVQSFVVDGSDIYVGGQFTTIGGQSRDRLAKLNNTTGAADATWDPGASSSVIAIDKDDDYVYVGGYFTTAGGQTRNRVARLNKTNGDADATWNPNPNGTIRDIKINNGNIYIAGQFTEVGSSTISGVARLNNTDGSPIPGWELYDGYDQVVVYSIDFGGDNFYISGNYYNNDPYFGEYFASKFLNPISHTSVFTLKHNQITQLVFNISSANSSAADGYIILYKQGSSFTGEPVDGGNYSVGGTIGDATIGAIITDANAIEATISGLTKDVQYHIKIYPFNWDGSDITTAEYKTDGDVPSLTVVTVPTLGEWGMIAFVGLMAIGGVFYVRKRIV